MSDRRSLSGHLEAWKLPKPERERAREIHRLCEKGGIPPFPPESCADIVRVQLGENYVIPFTHDLTKFSRGFWPVEGSFEVNKIVYIQAIAKQSSNLGWTEAYVTECVRGWNLIAEKHQPPGGNETSVPCSNITKISDRSPVNTDTCLKEETIIPDQIDPKQPDLNAPKIMIDDTPIFRPWTPEEARRMFKDCPDPLKKPIEFHGWLARIITLYDCLIPDVRQLLTLAYNLKWSSVMTNFTFPVGTGKGDWSTKTENGNWSRDDWIRQICLDSIKKSARTSAGDFGKVTSCIQGKQEDTLQFLQRFQSTWETSTGVCVSEHNLLAVQTLMNCLRPEVASAYKVSAKEWQYAEFDKTITAVSDLYRDGVFDTNSGETVLNMAQQLPENVTRPVNSKHPLSHARRRPRCKRRDICYRCRRRGHYAHECTN